MPATNTQSSRMQRFNDSCRAFRVSRTAIVGSHLGDYTAICGRIVVSLILDALDNLLCEVSAHATANGMHAYLVGSIASVPPTYEHDGYVDDGRLVKICPSDVPNYPLLEIELNGYLRLYKHRDSDLTRHYKGRRVTVEWVKQFISANAPLAAEIIANRIKASAPEQSSVSEPPRSLSLEDVESLHKERIQIQCPCGGRNENCNRCYGSGSYMVDGFGHSV